MADRSQWDNATFRQRENLLRRAHMPFEDYLREAAGQEWQDTDGTKVKIGQHPHHDVQHLCDQWCSSVEHCMNDLEMDLPDAVKDSYNNLQVTRRKAGMRPYAETLVKHYADHVGGRIREMAGMKGKSLAGHYAVSLSILESGKTTQYVSTPNPYEAYQMRVKSVASSQRLLPADVHKSNDAHFEHGIYTNQFGTIYSVRTVSKSRGSMRYEKEIVYVDPDTYRKIHADVANRAGDTLDTMGGHLVWNRT